MSRKDGTGQPGKGPKRTNQGVSTPKRVGGGAGRRSGQGRGGSQRGRGRQIKRGN